MLIFCTIITVLNILFLNSTFFGVIFGLAYFILLSIKFAEKFTPKLNFAYSLLLIFSTISFIGAMVYYFYQLNNLAISIILLTVPLIIKKMPVQSNNCNLPSQTKNNAIDTLFANFKYSKILTVTYLFLSFILFKYLFIFQTDSTIRSPWKVLPSEFFIYYFLATIILVLITLSTNKRRYVILIAIHFAISSSVALIIYKLGYGFDQFIHQATEKIIIEKGLVTPKPLYYLGQYSFVTILSKIFSIGNLWIDKLLILFSFSLFFIIILYNSLKKFFNNRHTLILILLFLIFPINSFIVTTPQNLANLFIIIIIYSSLPLIVNKEKSIVPLSILTLATVGIHPLAGLPALIFFSFVILFKLDFDAYKKRMTLIFLFILNSISIPLIFLINSRISNLKINLGLPTEEMIISAIYDSRLYFVNNFNLLFDFVYFYKVNFYILIFLLAMIIMITKYTKKLLPYFLSFIVLFINYLILNFLFSFDFLIDYEKSDYTNRILEISFYFLYPIIIYGIYIFLDRLSAQKKHLKIVAIIFIAGIITSSFYISYPRSDDYETSHSFNVTKSDIDTVHWINEDAKNIDFIVLANQQVSAAAILEFGFKKYYNFDQFYYPIPTSSPLYEYYLKMVDDKPNPEYMFDAMKSVGVTQGYFVINNYWWKFNEINKEAKKTADSYTIINNGDNIIFKYSIKRD